MVGWIFMDLDRSEWMIWTDGWMDLDGSMDMDGYGWMDLGGSGWIDGSVLMDGS